VQPETRYARLGQDRIAYQVFGQGPPDLVLAVGVTVDVAWEEPGVALWLRTLASFSRVILFDRRGSGASDPLPADPLPLWESFAEDLDAVMDAVGSERAAIFADLLDGPTALFFAGTRPERTSALILVHTSAKFVASDDYPIGIPAEVAEALLDQIDQLWGTDAIAAMWVPSRAGDERLRRWLAKMQRATASPRAAQASLRAVLEVDVRPVLPLIQAPTLVLHRKDFHASLSSRAITWPSTLPRPKASCLRHRRLDRAGQPAGRPALARAAGHARRTGPAAGRGVRRPAGQDHR
jgi:pimeloyl-ACP methyl ester carboxylesterase